MSLDQDKPFVVAAFICERVLQETDKVVSVMRIVDTFYVHVPEKLPTDVRPTFAFQVFIVIRQMKPEKPPIKHQVKLVLHTPSGKRPTLNSVGTTAPIEFDDPVFPFVFQAAEENLPVAANLVANVTLPTSDFGNYWFELILDGEPKLPIPFRVVERKDDLPSNRQA